MTYEEAKAKALTVEWTIFNIDFNGNLIYRISPCEPIMVTEWTHIDRPFILMDIVYHDVATHIVKLHNDSLKQQSLLTEVLNESEEILCSPLRFDGVHVDKIKAVFAKHGIVEESKF